MKQSAGLDSSSECLRPPRPRGLRGSRICLFRGGRGGALGRARSPRASSSDRGTHSCGESTSHRSSCPAWYQFQTPRPQWQTSDQWPVFPKSIGGSGRPTFPDSACCSAGRVPRQHPNSESSRRLPCRSRNSSARQTLSIASTNTFAPNDFAISTVRSVEPESTTMISPLPSATNGLHAGQRAPQIRLFVESDDDDGKVHE